MTNQNDTTVEEKEEDISNHSPPHKALNKKKKPHQSMSNLVTHHSHFCVLFLLEPSNENHKQGTTFACSNGYIHYDTTLVGRDFFCITHNHKDSSFLSLVVKPKSKQ